MKKLSPSLLRGKSRSMSLSTFFEFALRPSLPTIYPSSSLHGLATSVFPALHTMPNCRIRISALSASLRCCINCKCSIWWFCLPSDLSYQVATVTSSTYTMHKHLCSVKVSSTYRSIWSASWHSFHRRARSLNSFVRSSVIPISVFFNISSDEHTPLWGYGA